MLSYTTTIAPGNEVQNLLRLDSKAARKAVSILGEHTALNYVLELFKGNGWAGAYADSPRGNAVLLSDPKHPDAILLILKFILQDEELSYEETRKELVDFENKLSPKYGCSQFAIIAFNGISRKAESLERFNLLLQDWDYIDDLIKNYSTSKIQEPRIQLFAHNKQTYKKVCRMMKSFKSIAVVQATGTGKSFLIAKLLQDFTGEKRLVMAPSLYVIDQVKEHIRWDTGNIEYMSYARSMNLSQSEIASINPKMIVLDEFHRCGAEEWGRGVQNILNAFPEAFKFGTSATPVRYMDNARDMSVELFNSNVAENLSLAQAIVRNILPMPKYVCALYTLTEEVEILQSKIARSRLKEEIKKQRLLELDAVTIDWEQSHGIPLILQKYLQSNMRKFIVFCKDEEHLFQMEPAVAEWFTKATDNIPVKTYRIFDGEPMSAENLKAFKSADTKTAVHLLLSINMLNEGLHVNEVSGVVLLRPTESPNIFYQQIGRCLKVGLNYSPVIFDFVNNFKSIRTQDFLYDLEFAKSQYAAERINENLETRCPVFTVIDEVREITEVFGEIKFRLDDWDAMYERLVDYKEKFGDCNVSSSREKSEYRFLWKWLIHQRHKFKKGLLEPERRDRLVELGVEWKLDQLTGSRDAGWENRFEKLCEFRKKYGHSNVNDTNKEFGNLSAFVKDQRYRYSIGTLEEYRIARLNSIGFQFDRNYSEGIWQLHFDELVSYKNEYGHFKVPRTFSDILSQWIAKQRMEFRKGKLDLVRQGKLNGIGFTWGEDRDATFEKNFSELILFYKKHQHFKFPVNSRLAYFSISMRQQHRNKTLSSEKVQRLQAVGFRLQIYQDHKSMREKRLQQYEHFFQLNAHGNVNERNENYIGLGEWLKGQRKNYRKGLLAKDTIKRMVACSVIWNITKTENNKLWNSQYAKLLTLYKKTGTVVFDINKSNRALYDWCSTQRAKYKAGKLTEEQTQKLDALNFKWSPQEAVWEENFSALSAYKKQHGHCRVYQNRPGTKTLGYWCVNVRGSYKRGSLSEEKIKKLESLGFSWSLTDSLWHAKYRRLKKHLQKYTWEELKKKNSISEYWIYKQRKDFRRGVLAEEKIMLLNMLAIDWDPIESGWHSMYLKFLKYRDTYNKTLVSHTDKLFKDLYGWCFSQRKNYRANKIPAEKIDLLNKASFEWNVK